MAVTIDLNCDLGETVDGVPTADDAALFALISSANIACGFHAGDADTMRTSVERAADHGTAIGAHVGYDDAAGFGRRPIDIDPVTLAHHVTAQIEALRQACAEADGRRAPTVAYIKPHGALYNRIVTDSVQAEAVVHAARAAKLPLLGIEGSALEQAARRNGVGFYYESFVDRAYEPDATLTPRSQPGAVITDAHAVAQRAVRLVSEGVIEASGGSLVRVSPDSLCIHGDTADSVVIARAVRAALEQTGVTIRAFT